MNNLRKARKLAHLTLKQLSTLTSIDWRRLSEFELGKRWPKPEEAKAIEKALGVVINWGEKRRRPRPPVSVVAPFRTAPPGLPKPDRPAKVRLESARQRHPALYLRLYTRIDKQHRWFLHQVASDSYLEIIGWMQLLARGFTPYVSGCLAFGFRHCPVVHPVSRDQIPDAGYPMLSFAADDLDLVLFPQLYLRPRQRSWRVDALACAHQNGRRLWFVLELDGRGHSNEDGQDKEQEVALPFLRFATSDVIAGDFPRRVLAAIRGLVRPNREGSQSCVVAVSR